MASGHRRWRDVRLRHAAALVAMLGALCVAAGLYASRHFDFFYDDWDFVLAAPLRGLSDYFLPHNGHWVTLPALTYSVLLATFGARTYLPFMALLLVLHVAATFLLFLVVRRRAGDLPALLAAVTLLFLSRGWENILWAFQIAYGGSVVLGLLAMYLLDGTDASRSRIAVASAALTLGLMCSGVGLFFLAAIGVGVLLGPRRRVAATLVVPALAYAIWYVSFGRAGMPASLVSAGGLLALVSYVPFGIGAVAAGLVGLGPRFSAAALVALTTVLVARWTRAGGRVDGRTLGAATGLLTQFALTGLGRWPLGDLQAASPRYVYVGAVFLLLIVSDALAGLPWRGFWKLAPLLVAALLVLNVAQLRHVAATRDGMFETQAAMLRTVWLFRDAPGLDPDAVVDGGLMPQVRAGAYIASRRRLGSALPETTIEDLHRLPAPAVNRALNNVLPLRFSAGVAGDDDRACAPVDAAPGYVDVTAASGSTILVRSTYPGAVDLRWWLLGPTPPETALARDVDAGTSLRVTLPEAGPGLRWHLRVRPPSGSSLCGPTEPVRPAAASRTPGSSGDRHGERDRG